MKLRMTMATGLVVAALTVLGGCGKSADNSPEPAPNAGTTTSAAPSSEPTSPETSSATGAADLVGDWNDPDKEWTVHFHDDGTFVEDFQGHTDFRVGRYRLHGDTISLIGDDGNTDEGTITGDTLVFRLGTLTKS
jgi:hypothetical protein